MFWQYEFSGHKFPSILTVQQFIAGTIKRTKTHEISPNTMHYPIYLSILRLNKKVEINEKDIHCFYFLENELLVKTKDGTSHQLSYHYPTLVRHKIPQIKSDKIL